jgi:hypothetical protein
MAAKRFISVKHDHVFAGRSIGEAMDLFAALGVDGVGNRRNAAGCLRSVI